MGMMGGGQMPHSPMYQLERQLGFKHGPAHEMEKGSQFDEKPQQPGQPGQTPGAPGQQGMAPVPQQVPQTPMPSQGAQAVNPAMATGMGGMQLPQQGGMSSGV